ncbi:MAG: winged helix-turn-helix domain-containing protein [Acidobacteriaceae bacterium]|nr:winged helix-turn-helix domain-containing protein [Acidobacteriaceae bacterium]
MTSTSVQKPMSTSAINLADSARPLPRKLRFGSFEVDLQERELYNRGIRIGLQHKPFRILELLLRKRGVLVTREELAQYLWPDLHVSFDRGLNTAVNVLRRTLGDSPTNCRYIETRSGLGYRFIAHVEEIGEPDPAAVAAPAHSIAVLPFDAAPSDSTLVLLADGMTESLIARLSALGDIRVIARTTAFYFRGKHNRAQAQAAGSDLKVRTILTGRITREGEWLRISTELIEVESARRLWGDDFTTLPVGILSAEKKICEAVSQTLGLPNHRPRPVYKTYTTSFEAYQDYLKGRYFYSKMTEENLRKSIAYFESALKQDPGYALAYSGLANTYSLFALTGVLPAAVAHVRSREFALAALQIDHKLAEAHAALGGVKKLFEWDWAGAEKEYLTALDLNPNYADGRHWYAALLCCLGRMEEAMHELRRAQELDPLSVVISTEIAWTFYMSRDFQAAAEQSWKTLAIEAKHAPAQHTLGLACEQSGLFEEAITEFENARICSGDHPVTIAAHAHAQASSGNRDQALRTLRELEEISLRRHVSPYWMSIVHAGLGAHETAFEWLEKALDERDAWLVWMKVEPRFDPLRPNIHFDRALQRLGLL